MHVILGPKIQKAGAGWSQGQWKLELHMEILSQNETKTWYLLQPDVVRSLFIMPERRCFKLINHFLICTGMKSMTPAWHFCLFVCFWKRYLWKYVKITNHYVSMNCSPNIHTIRNREESTLIEDSGLNHPMTDFFFKEFKFSKQS